MFILYNSVFRNSDKEVEGVGSIYFRIISLIAFCRFYNFNFLHFKHHIGHNYNNIPNNEWDTLWDNFFNIKKLSFNFNDIIFDDFEIIKKHELEYSDIDILIQNKNNNILFYFLHFFPILYKNPNSFFKLIEHDIRIVYNEVNFNRPLIFDNNFKNIAIHIRVWNEFDTYPYHSFIDSYIGPYQLTEFYYISIINKLTSKFPNYIIHIFSQPSFIHKFPNIFNNKNLLFHFDIDAFNTIHHLINADVLVLGYSCFSFLTGIYNKNTVIYTNYPYIPKLLDRWIDIQEL